MKVTDSLAYLVIAGLIVAGSAGPHIPIVHGERAGQSQSQIDGRAKQLQQQPPRLNTDQEWKAAVEFMQENCPNRINFITNELQNRPTQLEHAKGLILKQYRQIVNIKDPQIHEIAVAQARIQDQVLGAQLKIKAAGRDQRKILDATTELKKAEEQRMVVQIALRKLRITRLQAEIDHFNKMHSEIVSNWTKEEVKKAISAGSDVTDHSTDDAVIDDSSAPPANKK